jgi:MFS family permease
MSNSAHGQSPDELQTLWSELPPQPTVTADQVRERARGLHASLRRRAIAGAVIMVIGIANPIVATLLGRRAVRPWEWAAMIYLAAVISAILWFTRASRRRSHPGLDGADCARFYRAMLERQRDANRGRLLAARLIVPVVALVVIAAVNVWAALPDSMLWLFAISAIASMGVIWYRGMRRAQLFQHYIDLLDGSVS